MPRARRPPRGSCCAAPSTPTGMAVSTNTRSPQTIGDELPRPGISTFHLMFLVSLHSSGGLAVFETPVADGPRHCGQNRPASVSCAAGIDENSAKRMTAANDDRRHGSDMKPLLKAPV